MSELNLKYKDPLNIDEILNNIKNQKTLKDINDFIKSVYPDWIMYFLNEYSNDYIHMQQNWHAAAKNYNIKPTQILIVEYLNNDEEHKLISTFAELFTLCGFIVRSQQQIQPCSKCMRAIPTKNYFDILKENIKIEMEWQPSCYNC
jgi:hypothetical protein